MVVGNFVDSFGSTVLKEGIAYFFVFKDLRVSLLGVSGVSIKVGRES